MQKRAIETRQRILDGLVKVIVNDGLAGVTHRAVAQVAGVSLAATTRHFATKSAMLTEVSEHVLTGYVARLERTLRTILEREGGGVSSLSDLLNRVTMNGLHRDRELSLAWCELMLNGGRSDAGRAMARRWFGEIDRIWAAIAASLGADREAAVMAVNLTVGNLVLLHPARLAESDILSLLSNKISLPAALENHGSLALKDEDIPPEAAARKVIDAAVEQLICGGPQSVSYRSVSQRAGLSRSAPSYHFGSVDALLQAAQLALFERAMARYNGGFSAFSDRALDSDRLVDVTTAILSSEAMAHMAENLAFYSVWVRSAASEWLRPTILRALVTQQRAWAETLKLAGLPHDRAFNMQAAFVGKLIRAIAVGPEVSHLALSRSEFEGVLQGRFGTFVQF